MAHSHLKTYTPIAPPESAKDTPKDIADWAHDELSKLSKALTDTPYVQFNVLHVAPPKPRDGMTVVADGADWNPGSGPGVYTFFEGVWVPLELNAGWFGAVGDGVTDNSVTVQEAIDFFSSLGGGVVQFGAGTFIFNTALVLKPNVILRGLGIDITILKVGVDDISLIDRWDTLANSAGVAGLEDMTVWGYADRNVAIGSFKLVNMGPFNLYWIRRVKAIYSRNMSFAAIGLGTGVVENCFVHKSHRDAINLTDTTHVFVTNNEIKECGDDAIAFHTSSAASGVNDYSARIIGNRIEKSFGIKCLGARNTTVVGNTLRFYYGYGIQYGLDATEGLIARFNCTITGNTMLDGLNGNTVGAGTIGYGIFLVGGTDLGTGGTAIAQYVGQYNAPGQFIQKPDVFINKVGAAHPKGPDGTITINDNTIRQTIAGITNFSDAGFGLLWNNTGPIDPAISSLLGEVSGIGIHDDLENSTINNNAMEGVDNGVEAIFGLNNVSISGNTLFRIFNNGISLISASPRTGSIVVHNNLIDIDPYLEMAQRTTPIDGTWTVTDSAKHMAIFYSNYNGGSFIGNRFRNCIRAIKSAGTGNYVGAKNIVEFDWSAATPKGIASTAGTRPTTDLYFFCNSDPTSASFNQYDPDFEMSRSSMPTVGWYFTGQFVQNNNPGLDGNNMCVWGWLRRTDGNAHVAGTDWITAYVSHVSPAT